MLGNVSKIMNIIWLHYFVILFSAAIVYFPSFSGEFILDDYSIVKDNLYIQNFHSLASYLSQEDGIMYEGSNKEYHSGYYRPLINLLYTLEYKLWGLNPSGFRATNIALHISTCFILYVILSYIFNNKAVSLVGVLFFALHPANTESVSWIASRNNILVTFFCLLSFYFYIKKYSCKNISFEMFSVLFFGVALLCKEFAVMLLPIFFIYDRIFEPDTCKFKKVFQNYLPFMIPITAYIYLRSMATGLLSTENAYDIGRSIYFAPYLIVYNLRIIFLPFKLHNFIIHYPERYFCMEGIIGLIGIFLLGLFIWQQKKNKYILFSLLAFLISILPVLHIIPTSSISLISMRWLYFPMSFICIVITWWLKSFLAADRIFGRVIVICVIFFYFPIYTYILNDNFWKTEELFFEKEINLFGYDFYLCDLGIVYSQKGDYGRALKYFQDAIEKKGFRDESSLYVNLSAVLLDLDRPKTALFFLEKPEPSDLWNELSSFYHNKGVAYFKIGDYSKAIHFLGQAVDKEPDNLHFLTSLSTAYVAAGNVQDAIAVYNKILDLGYEPDVLRKNLDDSYNETGDSPITLESFTEPPAGPEDLSL